MSDNTPNSDRKPIPERFQVAKATLRFDTFMGYAIQVGGVAIIVAVFGILAFILAQVLPLFGKAEVTERRAVPGETTPSTSEGDAPAIGLDEWAELPFSFSGGDAVSFTDLKGDRGTFSLPVEIPGGATISTFAYNPAGHRLDIGTSDGRVGSVIISYTAEFADGVRTIVPRMEVGDFYEVGPDRAPVEAVGYGASDSKQLYAALVGGELHVVTLKEKRGLFGKGKITKDLELNLSDKLTSPPDRLLVAKDGRGIMAISRDAGSIDYLYLNGGEFFLRQTVHPFADREDSKVIARADFLFGDVSIVTSSTGGALRIFSLFRPEGQTDRIFGRTKTFPDLPGGTTFFVPSLRNKAFLTGTGKTVGLYYATTGAVRWSDDLPFETRSAAIDGKFKTIALADSAGTVHLLNLDDHHPEAGAKAFFGKVWYEGANKPEYTWASTGGSGDFEVKLSMIPLIFGSLKGTIYALLFAIPIALLAAIYTSQFLDWKIKRVIKPTMEIMASLPSVVLGFIGALWLAPVLETKVPSVLLLCIGLPSAAALIGWAWNQLPVEKRCLLKPGYEFLVFVPILIFLAWAFWNLGPVFERVFFTVPDPLTGKPVSDFRVWWPQATGTPFEQRNSLVVGFVMGFAVIPIIFTIAEDALSNVPPALVAGSSALGASRWQVVRTVVLPIASAGIFSALMIGFGRAVGETMIMVMATGNTPVMEWDIFNGMRTLAANIAVELPEAPKGSTHFRALFLGALILFLFTFVLNTLAELLRHRLRERYKLV